MALLNKKLKPYLAYPGTDTSSPHWHSRKQYCLWSGFFLVALLVLRHDYVGTDTMIYRNVYNMIEMFMSWKLETLSVGSEVGFYGLVSVLHYLGLPFRFLLFLSAFVYVLSMSMLIYRYSQSPLFSYFLFICLHLMFATTMRQCFAQSFVVFAFLAALNNRPWVYIAFALLACTFHATAFVALPMYFITKVQFKIKWFWIFVGLGIAVMLLSSVIWSFGLSLKESSYDQVATTGYSVLFTHILLIVLGLLFKDRLSDSGRIWFFMSCAVLALFPLCSINPAFFRITKYYSLFTLVYIPNISSIKHEFTRCYAVLMIAFSLYSFTFGNYKSGIRSLPYAFYWEDYYSLNPEARKLGLHAYPAAEGF